MMQKESKKNVNNNEKQKAYHANLERYLDLKKQKDRTIPTVQLISSSNIEIKERVKFYPQEKCNRLMRIL